MTGSDTPAIDVVAGVIRRDEGPILISLRPQHLDEGGLWEFPGGKRESGESRFEALTRELHEELGIRVQRAVPLIRLAHRYPHKHVRLDVWNVSDWRGSPTGREGQAVRWVAAGALGDFRFPAANAAIITAARIPRLLPMPSATLVSSDEFPFLFDAWLGAGLNRWIVNLPPGGSGADLAGSLTSVAAAHGATVHFANAPPETPLPAGAGRHLNERELRRHCQVGECPVPRLSASVNSVTGFLLAERSDVEWIVIEPEFPSHAEATGVKFAEGLQACLDCSNVPAYQGCAFDSTPVVDALRAGYQGSVLTDGALTQAPDVLLAEFRSYLQAAAVRA